MYAITVSEPGGTDKITWAQVPTPEPGPGEVLVRTQAVGVNRGDVLQRQGHYPPPAGVTEVMGLEGLGVIAELGEGVSGHEVGEQVLALLAGGAYAEYVLAPAYQLAKVPSDVPCAQLGGAPLAGLTAYQSLFEVAHLKEGERVLIHAGAGGVGHLAVQLAAQAGAQVFATASAANHEFVRSLGAQPIDYRTEDFRAVLGQTMDVVLNSTGRQTFLDSLEVLVPGGRIVTLTNPDPLDVARERGFEAQWLTAHPDRTQMQEIARLMSLGLLKVHVEKIFPLAEAAAAQELMASGHTRGKIVLVP